MAGSVGGALAEGIERGMGLGFQIQDRERQAALDKRRQEDADRQFGLDQQRYDQQMARQTAADDRAAQAERRRLLDDEHAELVSIVQGMQQAGQQVPPELAQRISANAASRREYRDKVLRPALAAERQQHLDTFARIQSGEIDPATLPGADLYRGLSLATGRTPEQIMDSVQGAQQVQQGFEAKNQGMLLEGVNKLFAPDLRAGVGSESPYGGEIVRKEIVHLLPAKDANGQVHPDKVMPVVRVYVRRQDAVGPAMEGGAIGYYDAPLTENRSTDPNDTVKVVDLANAFDYMGKLGSLAAVLQNPAMQAKLAEGAKEVGEQTKADVDAITAMGYAKLTPEDRMLMQLNKEQRAQAAQVKAGLAAKAKEDPAGVQGLEARLGEIRGKVARGELSPAEGKRMEIAVIGGVRSATGQDYVSRGEIPAKPVKGKGGAVTTAKYTDDGEYRKAVHHWAQVIAAGGKMPPGTGRDTEFIRDVNLVVPQYSGGAREQLSNTAEYAGGLAGSRAVGTRAANFELAKSEAYTMADLVTQSSAGVNRTSFQPLNKAIVAFEKNTGDTKVREFGAALNSFINAYARAVSPIGSPTVSDKNHAREMLSSADSHAQVVAIIGQLKKEMDAAGRAPEIVREKQRAAMSGGLPTTGPAGRATKAPVVSDDDNALINKYLRK